MGVHRDAVPSQSRTWVERDKPVGLGRGRLHDFPDIDPEPVAHDGDLIHQPDVDDPERVLQELRHLRRFRGRHRHHLVHYLAVERDGCLLAHGRDPSHHPRRVLEAVGGIARVDPLRRERETEVLADLEAAFFQHRQHELPRRPRIRRALQHDQLAGAQACLDRARGLQDEGHVGIFGLVQGRRHADAAGVGLG